MTTLGYDAKLRDWTINGKSLIRHLEKHEGIDPSLYVPAFLSQSGVCDRLLGRADPDLLYDHIAIYLCGHCGGYDGSPIGIRIDCGEDRFEWTEIGLFSDIDDSAQRLFSKVTRYSFSGVAYRQFLSGLRSHEPQRA